MTFKLGGWWRLWIVLSVLWTGIVSVFAISKYSTPDYQPNFIDVSQITEANSEPRSAPRTKSASKIKQLFSRLDKKGQDELLNSLSNAELIHLYRSDDTEALSNEELLARAREYKSFREAETENMRNKYLFKYCFIVFLIWLVPLISVLGIGAGTAWVLNGFQNSRK